MGRATKRKIDKRGPLQRLYDAQATQVAQDSLNVLTEAQRANGDYSESRPIINRGGTPIMRWITAGKLSDTQSLAIQVCLRLWALTGAEQRTTAAYGERIAASSHIDEQRAINEIEAREDLHRIQAYIPKPYWDVFENVCRFDEPAGVSGSRLGFGDRSAQDRAHMIVCMVADTIAMHERLIPVTRILAA